MKGGVGKTTLAMQMALHAAIDLKKRVLAVDLDPQSNLSQTLLGSHDYMRHLKDNKPTIVPLLEGYLPATDGSGSPVPVGIHDAK